jgi:hypothetical protein
MARKTKKAKANPYQAFRQLERQLFLGVPEKPESFWQRDGNNAVTDRLTGRSVVADHNGSISLDGARIIAKTIYRPKSMQVTVEHAAVSQKKPKSKLIASPPACK